MRQSYRVDESVIARIGAAESHALHVHHLRGRRSGGKVPVALAAASATVAPLRTPAIVALALPALIVAVVWRHRPCRRR